MDIRKVKKLIEMLEESSLAEIEIREGEEAIRISHSPTGTPVVHMTPAHIAPHHAAPPAAAPAATVPAVAPVVEAPAGNAVASRMVGTFFFYALTGDAKYADFVRSMLLKYVDLYPTLGRHPAAAGEAAGRLFWQTLNESVWLVNTTQAYDCIYERLSAADRSTIESKLIRPMAAFSSEEHVHELDRIHNHGTWTCAAVGMAGYVMNDKNLVEKALYGSRRDRSGGFFRQLDLLFSPDGYFTEGLYYARYALLPFYAFAQVIENRHKDDLILL